MEQTIAQTYNKPSQSLSSSQAWPEIATLTRLTLALTYNPSNPLDIQLFLPEMCHVITQLVTCGSLLIRQSVYFLCVNIVSALAAGPMSGDMDGAALDGLLARLSVERVELLGCFGLTRVHGSLEMVGKEDEVDVGMLSGVENVARFLGEVIAAGAVSMGM
jgi:neurofibromin 1